MFHLNYFVGFNFFHWTKINVVLVSAIQLKKNFISSFYFPVPGLSCGMQTLSICVGSSSLTRDGTLAPCIGSEGPRHWTTRKIP